MEKIKNLKYYAMMLIVALTSLSFAACSDDDDDFGGDSELVGVWSDYERDNIEAWYLQFKSDGTVKSWLMYKGEKEDQGTLSWSTPSEGVLALTGKNPETGKQMTEKWRYSIKNDVLKVVCYDSEGNEYDDAEMHRVKK